jgi:hypothetical protein
VSPRRGRQLIKSPGRYRLIENYNFSSLDSLNVEGLKDQDYSIEVSRSNKESKNYTISNRDVPQIIKKLFKIIRN